MRNIPIELDCDINHARFQLVGQIRLEDSSGYCSATLDFDRNRMPSGFEPELLSYVVITGYPNVCLVMQACSGSSPLVSGAVQEDGCRNEYFPFWLRSKRRAF